MVVVAGTVEVEVVVVVAGTVDVVEVVTGTVEVVVVEGGTVEDVVVVEGAVEVVVAAAGTVEVVAVVLDVSVSDALSKATRALPAPEPASTTRDTWLAPAGTVLVSFRVVTEDELRLTAFETLAWPPVERRDPLA